MPTPTPTHTNPNPDAQYRKCVVWSNVVPLYIGNVLSGQLFHYLCRLCGTTPEGDNNAPNRENVLSCYNSLCADTRDEIGILMRRRFDDAINYIFGNDGVIDDKDREDSLWEMPVEQMLQRAFITDGLVNAFETMKADKDIPFIQACRIIQHQLHKYLLKHDIMPTLLVLTPL